MIRLSAFADEISPEPKEQIAVLQRFAIRHIEFRSIYGTNVLDLTDDQHDAFRDLLRERGFGLSAIGSPVGKIKITDPFEPHLGRFERALHLAEFYEAPRVRVFSFYIPEGDRPEAHRAEVLRRMSELTRLAELRHVTLVLENEKGIYGDTADRVKDVLETIHSPALSHAFDPANYLEVGESIDRAWEMLKARTVHFHVKDYDVNTRKNVVAGAGQGRIPELIAEAVAAGYEGFCTLEPHLLVAGASHGFTGPDRFADAARALQRELDARNVPYA